MRSEKEIREYLNKRVEWDLKEHRSKNKALEDRNSATISTLVWVLALEPGDPI